jgi:hypothetical protein
MSKCKRCGSEDRFQNGNCKPCDKARMLAKVGQPCSICGSEDRTSSGQCRPCKKVSKLKKYGLTTDEFEEMFTLQFGLCECCGDMLDSSTVPCVDHCHDSGAVRAILCRSCNTGLGGLKDDLDRACKMVAYIKSHVIPNKVKS